ncbi:MAG: ROK family protein [Methanothrix sp.]
MASTEPDVLGLDVGGTKTAWGVISSEGKLKTSGTFPTPSTKEEFLEAVRQIVKAHPVQAMGIGIAGIVSSDHQDLVVSPYLPQLSHFELVKALEEECGLIATIDNDARCALIGEVWLGAASDVTSAVLITLGTGVGGAVMQKGVVLPHPHDLSQELGRIMANPADLFPAPSGKGTVEALIGGRNLAERFGLEVGELLAGARAGDPELTGFVSIIAENFMTSLRAIHEVYSCKLMIIGGKGLHNLDLYLGANPPCQVVPAVLGEQAGIYGAARLALDALEMEQLEQLEWGE